MLANRHTEANRQGIYEFERWNKAIHHSQPSCLEKAIFIVLKNFL